MKDIKLFNDFELPDNLEDIVAKPKSLLEAFEYIVELAKGSAFNDEFMRKADVYIKYASRKLKLPAMQTVLLAMFIDRSEDNSIMLSEIAGYVGCRTTRILRLSKEVDELERMHYLRARRGSDRLSYRVPRDVLSAIKDDRPYCYTPETVADTTDFFDYFNRLCNEHDSCELPYADLVTVASEYLDQIAGSHFAREMKRRFPNDIDDEKWLFIYMAHLFIENSDDNIRFSDIENLYDDNRIPGNIKLRLRNHCGKLFNDRLIENTNEDGMVNAAEFKLTDFAKEDILAELNLKAAGRSDNGLIKHESVVEKRLIYNPAEQSQIDSLMSILSAKRFAQVQERLEKAGMRKGFCCLFYGAPGTGKTETVYQLARATGRDIMRVDVDKIKSCWVGESEKNIKKLFDSYRAKCNNAELAPILLFNEADAVLGIRMEGAQTAVNKMENSIQNIILQEMETLEGIMIATTNLTSNLDKAFERRFLYKIRYEKPTVEARAEIWQTMLHGLSSDDAKVIASEFDLSGGEIENIARKHAVNAILSGSDELDLDALIDICRVERITHTQRPRVGF